MPRSNPTLFYLYNLQRFGIKAGLKNITTLLDDLGHPERSFPVIHIAGTNGKGSTAAMIASILTASGYRTGLYTSPHLVRFNERIRIDGREIVDEDVVNYTRMLKPGVDRLRATFFEATTAIAFQYFVDRNVEIAVIETGLGGRWDATNVVRPVLSIITSIALDHTEHLGATLERIAFEKGGIIKNGVPILTGVENPRISDLLRRIAFARHAPISFAAEKSQIEMGETTLESFTADIITPRRSYRNLTVSLCGSHQARNARLAIIAAESLAKSFTEIQERDVRHGLLGIRRFTGLRGRLEVLSGTPLCIADVGHNPEAIATIARSLRSIIGRKLLVLFGVMRDKDYRSMIIELKRLARLVIAVSPDTPRALESRKLAAEFHRQAVGALDGKSVREGIVLADAERRDGEAILIIGSHYVVGEAMSCFPNSS